MSLRADIALADVYVECLASQPACPNDGEAALCLALHRVEWLETLESTDSGKLLCHFRAPDAEAVRIALRCLDIPIAALWVGSQ